MLAVPIKHADEYRDDIREQNAGRGQIGLRFDNLLRAVHKSAQAENNAADDIGNKHVFVFLDADVTATF